MHPLEAQPQPRQRRTPRMQTLARLPIFLDLDGKRALPVSYTHLTLPTNREV